MPKIEFSFIVYLQNFSSLHNHYGPLFTHWLPNGENDSLQLQTIDPSIDLRVWFKQKGFIQNGLIEFDYNRQEVEQSIVENQGVLEAGPLFGKFSLTDLSEKELEVIQQDDKDNQVYVNLGKRIYKLLHQPVSRLIRILQVNFGQYWINDVPEWDNRHESLGSYLQAKYSLKWKNNTEDAWKLFCPTQKIIGIPVTLPDNKTFAQYISKEDYSELQEILISDYDPYSDSEALLRAHINLDQRNLVYAFIDACTALEFAISTYIRQKCKGSKSFTKVVNEFFNQKKETQLLLIALGIGDLSEECLDLAIAGINLRNRIVHDGYIPNHCKEEVEKLEALLIVTTKLLPGEFYRFPTINPGNALFGKEE